MSVSACLWYILSHEVLFFYGTAVLNQMAKLKSLSLVWKKLSWQVNMYLFNLLCTAIVACSSMVLSQSYGIAQVLWCNNGDNTPHTDNLSLVTQLLLSRPSTPVASGLNVMWKKQRSMKLFYLAIFHSSQMLNGSRDTNSNVQLLWKQQNIMKWALHLSNMAKQSWALA